MRMGLIGLLIICLSFVVSCTREIEQDLTLNLNIPTSLSGVSSKVSAQSALRLQVVIINMRPNAVGPVSQHIVDFNGGPGAGSFISIEVPSDKVPRSPNLLIQYLGVFEGNGMVFTYGKDTINSDQNGLLTANITATQFGAAGQFGRVHGRYLPAGYTAAGPYAAAAAPTGKVSSYFKPNSVDPRMLINESDMVAGWFNLISIAGIPFEHEVEDRLIGNNRLIFNGAVDGSSFQSGHNSIAKINTPDSFRKERDNGSVSADFESQSQNVFGFFADGIASGNLVVVGGVAGKKACYQDGADQIIPGLFSDSGLTSPLVYDHDSASGVVAYAVAGAGVASSTCTIGNMFINDLFVNPDWMVDGYDGAVGLRAPFAAVNYKADFKDRPEFARVTISSASNPVVTLSWKYLDGADASAAVDGARVYKKLSTNGGDYDDSDDYQTCDETAAKNGYVFDQDVSAGIESASITQAQNGNLFTFVSDDTNVYNHAYMVCPYSLIAAERVYFTNAADASCAGNCGEDFHYGLTPPVAINDVSVASFEAIDMVAGGAPSREVNGVSPASPSGTYVDTTNTHAFNTGDEVLVRVTGMNLSGDCGSYHNENIDGAWYHFARVLPGGAANQVRIAEGSWVDNISANAGNVRGATNYCSVHISKVPHFGNLIITGSLQPNGAFSYDGDADGIIPLRVSGQLTFGVSGNIDARGFGYAGAAFADGESFLKGDGAKLGNAVGGGGGAYSANGGDGASNPSSAGQSFNGSHMGDLQLDMGAAGGGVNTVSGALGAAAVFVSARQIVANNPSAEFLSSGSDGGSNGGEGAGGGSGGPVNIHSESVTGSQNLTVDVSGGDGGAATTNGGGGGSAGFVSTWLCPSANLSGSNSIEPDQISTAGQGGIAATIGSAADPTPSFNFNFAYECP